MVTCWMELQRVKAGKDSRFTGGNGRSRVQVSMACTRCLSSWKTQKPERPFMSCGRCFLRNQETPSGMEEERGKTLLKPGSGRKKSDKPEVIRQEQVRFYADRTE